MARIPGLKADVFFGDIETPLPDWRDRVPDDEGEEEDEEERPSESELQHVVALLGFDPNDPDADDDEPEADADDPEGD